MPRRRARRALPRRRYRAARRLVGGGACHRRVRGRSPQLRRAWPGSARRRARRDAGSADASRSGGGRSLSGRPPARRRGVRGARHRPAAVGMVPQPRPTARLRDQRRRRAGHRYRRRRGATGGRLDTRDTAVGIPRRRRPVARAAGAAGLVVASAPGFRGGCAMTPGSIAIAMLLAALAPTTLAATPHAETIIAAAKRASGGSAWDRPQGCTETGSHGDGAIAYRTRFSLHGYGIRIDSDRGGQSRSMGFDGKTSWQAAGDRVERRDDPASLAEAITSNYLSINGFFFPRRFPATLRYRRAEADGARRFDVVEITPRGGRPLEIWFDRASHLIGRVVDATATPAVRVDASDYRRGPGGLTVAYRLDVFAPDGARVDRGAVTSFACGTIDPAAFAPPPAP
ncbi:hypothetical protein IP88_05550 [alpha proteobacterium AAP81b]|nr:hypothetical protein IP88_05550 [alpha proteobacterium AAP81b]